MKFWIFLLALVLGQPVAAQVTAMTWQGQLIYEPSDPIPGGTLGVLMSEIFGPEAITGSVPVAGRFGLSLAAPMATANNRFAAAPNAVTEMSVTFGGVTMNADIARIAQQGHLSRIGSTALTGGPFCTTFAICDFLGLPRASWGNQAYVILQSSHVELVEDGTRLDREEGATFGVMVGLTPQFADFQPAIATRFGAVAIDGMSVNFQSFPGRPVFQSLTLPHLRILEGTRDIESADFSIDLEIEGLQGAVSLSGVITAAEIDR